MDLSELPGSTSTASLPSTASYWCYQCTRLVPVASDDSDDVIVCPHCHGGFIQVVDPTDFSRPFISPSFSRLHRNGSSFNPLILFRPPPMAGGGQRRYDLYYDDGTGLGLRPLPSTMPESLLGSGFELILDRLSQIGFSLWGPPENPPASKHAVASLPTIQISPNHVDSDSHCAVCMDAFTLRSDAREMPCKHIYHPDCIFPWLNLHSSCPVCRQELPSDEMGGVSGGSDMVGLSIWRFPGGDLAIGRFAGGGNGEMPAVYSEMDGSLSLHGGVYREIEWGPWIRRRIGGGLQRLLGSIFRRAGRGGYMARETSPVRRSGTLSGSTSIPGGSIFSRYMLRRNRRTNTVGTGEER
ncbi:hypothetical protein OROGR_032506 [Orobanche gracilis]